MNILVLTYWSFDDALVQTYTLPYLRIIREILPAGSKIFLVTLEKENSSQEARESENGIYNLSFPLHPFGLNAILGWRKNISFLEQFCSLKNISAVHTWCTPAGTIGYLLSKKTGLPLICDSYEPHAEPMVETGTWKKGGLAFRILFHFEKKQTRHARYLIGVTQSMKEYAQEKYGYRGDNFFCKPACVDFTCFNLSHKKNPVLLKKMNLEEKWVGVYAGKFGGLYLRDEVFAFFRIAFEKWGDRFRVLLLTSTPREAIDALCQKHSIEKEKVISAFVPHREIPAYLGLGDFALSAFKPVPSRKFCTPIKNGEYWAMGLPVVIPENISDDSAIIEQNNAGVVAGNFSAGNMDTAVERIALLLHEDKKTLAERIHALAVRYRNFNIATEVYRKIYGEWKTK